MDNSVWDSLSLKFLKNNPIGEQIKYAMDTLRMTQEALYTYKNDDKPDSYKLMKIGTIIVFSIVTKVVNGKKITDFNRDDWEDIASNLTEYAVLLDGQLYSVMIFTIYASYIDSSAETLKDNNVSADKCNAITHLSKKIRTLGRKLSSGEISEGQYTEECLWVILEAMIKLLNAYSELVLGKEKADFVQSLSLFAFEYGRYTLFMREQELLEEFLMHQEVIDEELQKKWDSYIADIQTKQEEFYSLLNNSYEPDAMTRFRSSIRLAEEIGIPRSELLVNISQVDEFFS